MAQTLIKFDTPVTHRDGRSYIAMACGRERDNGQWEAWLEFEDVESGEILRSQRETTQPNQKDTVYWATGLTPVYLEGALDRILHPPQHQRAGSRAAAAFRRPRTTRTRGHFESRADSRPVFRVRQEPQFAGSGTDGAPRLALAADHQGFRAR